MAVDRVILGLLFFLISRPLWAEPYNPLTPQNFYIKPVLLSNNTYAPDLDNLIRQNLPEHCPLAEIDHEGADYVLAIDFIEVNAEAMNETSELIEVTLSLSLTYSLTGAVIKEKPFKSAILEQPSNEQELVYNLTKEMIISASQSFFKLICKEPSDY